MITGIDKEVKIKAPVAQVWKAITEVTLMAKWMGAPELKLEIETSWTIGTAVMIKGFHHVRFENKGTVLEYVPERVLSYDFLSSLSRLPDTKENHTIVRFTLLSEGEETLLSLQITNFPTETIYQHLNFYWNTTWVLLRKFIENSGN